MKPSHGIQGFRPTQVLATQMLVLGDGPAEGGAWLREGVGLWGSPRCSEPTDWEGCEINSRQ